MKKFFSLFCALAIVLSASAVPAKKVRAAKFQRVAVEQLRAEKNVAPSFKSTKASSLRRAAKATADVIDVKCASWDIEDWGTDGELSLYGEDNTYAFYFDLIYGGDATDLVLGQTYTAEDIYVGEEGQYGGVFYDGEWHYGIKQLSLVKTIDQEGLVHFVGSCIDSLDAAFSFHYDETPFVPTGEEVEHSFAKSASLSYSSYYKDWTIKVSDAAYALKLDIFSEDSLSAVGEYDSANEDFDLGYTNVEVIVTPDSSNLFQPHSATASITERNDSIFIHAEIMAENGVLYKFDAFYADPQKQGEAAIIATNLVLDDSWYGYFGVAWADASNDDYAVSLTLSATSGTLTAGTEFGGSIINKATGEEAEIYSGSITISNIGGLLISGTVLCYDNIEYTLTLSYVLPEPSRQETIDAAGYLYLANQGETLFWQSIALNADSTRYVSLFAIADDPAGTYGLKDLYAQYTYIGVFTAPADTAWYEIIDANITVAVNGEVATINGTLLGQNEEDESDVVEFTINLNLQVADERSTGKQYDEEEADFIHDFDTFEIDDRYLAQYGSVYVTAQDGNEFSLILDITLADGATELSGVYPVADQYISQSVYAGYYNSQYGVVPSFASTLVEDGGELYYDKLWFLTEGAVTVNDNGSIDVEAVNSYGRIIRCHLGEATGVENVEAAEAKAVKVIRNGQLFIINNGVEYNAQGALVK